jgi:drug/metabolite transporter (DMT)-like permease
MSGLWAIFAVLGAAGQTARNAMQRELTSSLGAVGATHVRFLFGFPFALLFLAVVTTSHVAALPATNSWFWIWIVLGTLTQIAGTALMLMTMTVRSFVVSIAYLKTEPIFVAALGLVFLHDPVTLPMGVAILVATAGVILISVQPGSQAGGMKPALLGLASGALFACSAIGYRGAILAIHSPSYVMGATFTLAIGLVMQAAFLTVWLLIQEPAVLRAIVRMWKPSLFAGFMGAVASEFWFLAFALATAASVRTIALVEVLFAQAVTHLVFRQRTLVREAAGILLLLGGTILLVRVHP